MSEETLNHSQKHLTKIWQGHISYAGSQSLHCRELTRNVFCILLHCIVVSGISWREMKTVFRQSGMCWCGMYRAVGCMQARSSVRNCWSWFGGWRRTTRRASWLTKCWCCCGTWRRVRTSPLTSWIRRLPHISKFSTTVARKSVLRCEPVIALSDLLPVVCMLCVL